MVENEDTLSRSGTTVIDVPSIEVLADKDATFTAKVTCEPACDLSGERVEVRDSDGAVLAAAEMFSYDGESNETDEIRIKAPRKAGQLTWTAVLPAHETDGVSYPEASAAISVTVTPHPVHMTVWGLPYATNGGEEVTFKAGVKCGAGCMLAGARVAILDGDGHAIANADTGHEPWQGTEGLYVAEFSVKVPSEEGEYGWEATLPESDETISHAKGTFKFNVRVVPPPECVVTLEVVAGEGEEPVQGARIVMHPYRAETDERGIANINAAKGNYTIFVSKAKYDPMSKNVDLTEDFSTRVALVEEEPDYNPDDGY